MLVTVPTKQVILLEHASTNVTAVNDLFLRVIMVEMQINLSSVLEYSFTDDTQYPTNHVYGTVFWFLQFRFGFVWIIRVVKYIAKVYCQMFNSIGFVFCLLTAYRAGVDGQRVFVNVLLAGVYAVHFLIASLAWERWLVIHVDDFMQLQLPFGWESVNNNDGWQTVFN